MGIVHSYTAVVRGYHYYKQFSKPAENDEKWQFGCQDSTQE